MDDERIELVRRQSSPPINDGRAINFGTTTQRRRASPWTRWSPLLAILLSTALSCFPAALYWSSHAFDAGSNLYDWSTHSRASVQVVINIVSSVFAFLWAWSVASTFNLYMRSALSSRQLTVNELRIHSSLSRRAVDTNLPFLLLLPPLLFAAACLVPAWLWTGALTPQIASRAVTSSLFAVNTGNGSYPFLGSYDPIAAISVGCNYSIQTNGSFSNCPGFIHSGRILDSMGTASSPPGVPRNHSKLDNSGFSYEDRSYGVGSSVGLQKIPVSGIVGHYNFSEVGYLTTAKCSYNRSADFNLSQNVTFGIPGIPDWFWQQGYRPNMDWTKPPPGAAALPGFDPEPINVVGWSAGSCCNYYNGTGPFQISIAAGADYGFLNQTQCDIFFAPTKFDVGVNAVNRTIQVTPLLNATGVSDPEPRGYLREWSLKALTSLALIESTLYISTIGQNLISNVVTKLDQPNFNASITYNDAVLPALEDSLAAALDDILENIGGYALTQNSSNIDYNRATTFQVSEMKIGEKKFIVALFVINLLALIVIASVYIFEKAFAESPVFDFADIGAMVLGMRSGQPSKTLEESAQLRLAGWTGDPSDPSVRSFRVDMDSRLGVAEAPHVRVISKNVETNGYTELGGTRVGLSRQL